MSRFHFFQCATASCRFRFPADIALERPDTCPRCGGEITATESVELPTVGVGSRLVERERHLGGLLDNVRSAYNVGSMLRTSDGAGLDHLYLCGITPSPEQKRVVKTSLGAERKIGWSYHNNAYDLAVKLKDNGFVLWALERVPKAVSLFDAALPRSVQGIILVVGNERSGIDPAIQRICDSVVFIPMYGKKKSLNVAVAFGIAAYHLRHAMDPD